jgi:hypothetical protein
MVVFGFPTYHHRGWGYLARVVFRPGTGARTAAARSDDNGPTNSDRTALRVALPGTSKSEVVVPVVRFVPVAVRRAQVVRIVVVP